MKVWIFCTKFVAYGNVFPHRFFPAQNKMLHNDGDETMERVGSECVTKVQQGQGSWPAELLHHLFWAGKLFLKYFLNKKK